jgi:hypothetical protein
MIWIYEIMPALKHTRKTEMESIYKQAVNEMMSGRDGMCAWAGEKLRYLALRQDSWSKRDETDPDYKDWMIDNGFEAGTEGDEFERWVWFFSGLIDGQVREIYGRPVESSLKKAIMYRSNIQRDYKQAQDSRYNEGEHRRLREEDHTVWGIVNSAEEDATFPEGSYDTLKEKLEERRQTVKDKHKESPYKQERLTTLDLAISNC